MNDHFEKSSLGNLRPIVLTSASIIIIALLVFRVGIFSADKVLFTTDGNIGAMADLERKLPGAFVSYWSETPLLGNGGGAVPVSATRIMLALLPPRLFVNLVYPLCLGLASLFLVAFFRERKIGWLPSLLGALTACWVGTNLTLVYAGHTAKYGTIAFATMALWCIEKNSKSSSIAWSVLSGGGCGCHVS